MTFWIIASLLALAVAALLALALLRGRALSEPAAAYDLRVYRDQLATVDRDLARGVIGKVDAERVRTEISRRILAADAQVHAETETKHGSQALTKAVALLFGGLVIAGSLTLYRSLGAPGYGDMPLSLRIEMATESHSNRPGQTEAEDRMPALPKPELDDTYAGLLTKLRETVAERPDDLQGHILLAQHEAQTGNFDAAYAAKARAIELLAGDVSARDYSEQAEMMILAAGGYVSPEAEAVLLKALNLDPAHGPTRYYWGLMLTQIGRPDVAFRIWEETLTNAPADASWARAIRERIPDLAMRAGVDYTPPQMAAALPGPSAEDMEAAAGMDSESRKEMIRGMVERLSERLATDGGTPAEWARLIGALGVLGDTERASAILAEARDVFADSAEALQLIDGAAAQAGLDQ